MVRESHLRILGGNGCAAALLSVIIYWTDNKLRWNDEQSSEFGPRIPVTKKTLNNALFDLYRRCPIDIALSVLRNHGLIEYHVDQSSGNQTWITLCIGELNRRLLALEKVIEGDEGGIADEQQKVCRKTADPVPGNNIAPYKERAREDSATDKREEKNSPKSPLIELRVPEDSETETTSGVEAELLDLSQPVEIFLRDSYRRERGLRFKTSRRADRPLVEQAAKLDSPEFREGLILWLREESDWLKENGWPLPAYLKQAESGAPPRRYSRPAGPGRTIGGEEVPRGASQNSNAPAAIVSEKLKGYYDAWNRDVPAGQAVEFNPRIERRAIDLLRGLDADPVFRDKFPVICEQAQAILKARKDDAGWLSFHWLLKDDNWTKLLNGQFRWMTKPPTTARVTNEDRAMAALNEAMASIGGAKG